LVNIMKTKDIKRVYMPSYCCGSMLSPFEKLNIEIIFYDVLLSETGITYDIDYSQDIDLFFAMSYFGVGQSMDEVLQNFSASKTTILQYISHRLVSQTSLSKYAA